MERLTQRMPGGYGLADGHKINDLRSMRAVVDRLASYEETGLQPDTISKIRDIVLDISGDLDRLRELAQADREGRCVMFQPGYAVVSIYNPADEDGLYTMKVTGVITKEEYEAALRREQDD